MLDTNLNLTILINKTLIFIGMLFIISFNAQSQIEVMNADKFSSIKEGTTYVVMNDPTSEETAIYRNVFKKYWKFTNVQFIKNEEIENYLSPGNSFFSFVAYVGMGTRSNYYFQLWAPSEKFFKQRIKDDRKRETEIDRTYFARIMLDINWRVLKDVENMFKIAYKNENFCWNWGPGFLKNYLQALTVMFNEEKEKSIFESALDKKQMKILGQKKLYIPEYAVDMGPPGQFASGGDLVIDHHLMKKYEYGYKIISKKELNEKILSETEPFYYLLYSTFITEKFVHIINSHTGEFIYSEYSPMSSKIKAKDFKQISKSIR